MWILLSLREVSLSFRVLLFFRENIRVNRPLYIFLGWLIYKPLKLLGAEELIPNDMANLCLEGMKLP